MLAIDLFLLALWFAALLMFITWDDETVFIISWEKKQNKPKPKD
jgi:hypothetical protein